MIKKIAWVTDSTSSLDKEFVKKHNIHIVPLNVIFGEESFKENVDITDEEFYEKLKNSKYFPKTSQPAIGDFVTLYEKLKEEYDCAIAVHCSSKLSGTMQGSIAAAEMVGFDVKVIDSKIGSYPVAKMIEKGIELQSNGEYVDTIVPTLENMADKARLHFVPANLEQLHKGGRVSSTQAFIGSLLQLKLILGFNDGVIDLNEKVRSNKKAKAKMFDMLALDLEKNNISEIAVLHCNNAHEANFWKNELQNLHPKLSVTIMPLITVVAVHAGEGTVGLSWINN